MTIPMEIPRGLLPPDLDLEDTKELTAEVARRLREQARCDEVTGLPNRSSFLQQLNLSLHEAGMPEVAVGTDIGWRVLSLKISRIDELATSMGRGAADALATALAARLSDASPPGALTSHLGGGEFAQAWRVEKFTTAGPGPWGDEPALQHAQALLGLLQEPVQLGPLDVHAPCSIGMSRHPIDGIEAHSLLGAAQSARQQGGHSAVTIHQSQGQAAALRALQMESALRNALAGQELSIVYQPQVSLDTGAVVGAEALMRWQSEAFGELAAAEFVPVAERTGLIVAMGEWAFGEVCAQIVRWRRAGLKPLRVAVNVSPVQLQLGDLRRSVQEALTATGADPACLALELTETALKHDPARVAAMLRQLHDIGIGLDLDDFGTGQSSLGTLRLLPVDLVKIDRSFIHELTHVPESAAVTRAVIQLAHALSIPVVAEGVETEGQLMALRQAGCDRLQGHLFSPPVEAATLTLLIEEGRGLPLESLSDAANDLPERERTLLLVDDERQILQALKRLFRRDGYKILTAESGTEALELLAQHPVDVIVSDQRMPGMEGTDFLRRARALYPDSVRMTLSGYTDLQSIIDAVNEGAVYKFLTKPWDDERLRAHVAQAFEQKGLADENHDLRQRLARQHASLPR